MYVCLSVYLSNCVCIRALSLSLSYDADQARPAAISLKTPHQPQYPSNCHHSAQQHEFNHSAIIASPRLAFPELRASMPGRVKEFFWGEREREEKKSSSSSRNNSEEDRLTG